MFITETEGVHKPIELQVKAASILGVEGYGVQGTLRSPMEKSVFVSAVSREYQ